MPAPVPSRSPGTAAAAATTTRAQSLEPRCQPRDPGPGPRAEGSRGAGEEVLSPAERPPRGRSPRPRCLARLTRPKHWEITSARHLLLPSSRSTRGSLPRAAPETRSWREPIKAGDGATRGHTVQAPEEQPPLERRQLLPCLDQPHDHGPSLGIRQAQR